jgi:hypothetical protein
MRRSVAATLALLVATCPALARDVITCQFPASPDVVVRLEDRKLLGQMLNCIEGSFTHGVTSCAPNNAFSFSPNGSILPTQYVSRWEDIKGQDGSMVHSVVTPDAIGFEGFPIFFGRRDETQSWRFVITLSTGMAQLVEGNNFHPPLTFICAKSNAPGKTR